LIEYAWPGNVRQLKHFTEQLVLNQSFACSDDTLESLYRQLLQIVESPPVRTQSAEAGRGAHLSQTFRAELDSEAITSALQQARFNRTKAAEILGVGRTTLWRKMKEFNLE
jgi:DNA-binding NtrC family response regulator